MGGYGCVSPRHNYGLEKPTGLKNRVGGLINYEFLDKAFLTLKFQAYGYEYNYSFSICFNY